MSAMALDLRPTNRGQSVGMFGVAAGESHPRAQGFRVLSRIARSNATDEAYSPRHRMDVEPEVSTSLAR